MATISSQEPQGDKFKTRTGEFFFDPNIQLEMTNMCIFIVKSVDTSHINKTSAPGWTHKIPLKNTNNTNNQ